MGLPLLRLPHLVITNLVDITGIEDLTCLSLCSKRARNILIVCRRQNRFKGQYIRATVITDRTSVDVVTLPVIEVIQISNLESYLQTGCSKDCQLFSNRTVASVTDEIGKLESVEIGGQRVPCFRYSGVLLTFWEDETIGFRKCMGFARETFGMPVKLLEFSAKGMWAFDWINRWEEKIQQMTVQINGIQFVYSAPRHLATCPFATVFGKDHELKYVLEKCESRNLVTSRESPVEDNKCYPSKSFGFDFKQMKSKCFFTSSARWITLDSLLYSRLAALEIEDSHMTNYNLWFFWWFWRNDMFPHLRQLFVQLCEPISIATIQENLGNALWKTNYQIKFSKKGYEQLPYAQYDLQQTKNGNKRACIRFYNYKNSVLMRVRD